MYLLKKGKTDGPFQPGKSLISTRVTSSVVFFVVVVVIFTGKKNRHLHPSAIIKLTGWGTHG